MIPLESSVFVESQEIICVIWLPNPHHPIYGESKVFKTRPRFATGSYVTSLYCMQSILDPLTRVCLVVSVLYEIYRPDNKPFTLMLPVNASVHDVMSAIVKPVGDHVLVKMNSSGGWTCQEFTACFSIYFLSY